MQAWHQHLAFCSPEHAGLVSCMHVRVTCCAEIHLGLREAAYRLVGAWALTAAPAPWLALYVVDTAGAAVAVLLLLLLLLLLRLLFLLLKLLESNYTNVCTVAAGDHCVAHLSLAGRLPVLMCNGLVHCG
jgi:hypothetical protein